jgi:hypothetical protein
MLFAIVAPASSRVAASRRHATRRSSPGANPKGRRRYVYATVLFFMATRSQNPQPEPDREPGSLYCPNCAEEVTDPLTCGDCSSVICRKCGTALESSDELGIG